MSGALESEVRREQEHVDRAAARLEQLRAEAARSERASLARDQGGNPQSLYERDVTALAAAARRSDLDLAGEGLVFGRLDLGDGTVHHVGRTGLRTESQDPIVVDWRAPAAAPFYRATAADPLGVVRRRTIATRGTTVRGIEDELLDAEGAAHLEGTTVVGDGAFLLAAVSRERGPRMRDIVATIQREQDEAVRAPDDGALVVTGGPGTGKTAVALHRVAYLMYARRDWYGRRGVLVVGPSPVFVDHIGAVLPALGETSVRLASLGRLPHLPAGLVVEGDDPPAVAAVKGSARMVPLLRRVVRELGGGRRVPDLELARWGTGLVLPGEELARRRGQVARGARSSNAGRAAFLTAVTDLAWRAYSRRPGAGKEEPGDREDFARWLRGDPAVQRWLDQVWPVLLPAQVLQRLRGGRVPLARLGRGLFSEQELADLARSWSGSGPLTALDAAVFDELAELLGPPPEPEPDEEADELAELEALALSSEVTTFADRTRRVQRDLAEEQDYRTYAHVVVDEAQDVAPLQWRMLARRARGATWTVVGDWVQSAWPDVDEVRTAMAACLGRARVRVRVLTTNYRTSTEIAELAARVLSRIDPDAVPPAAVRSTGAAPVLRGGPVGEAVADLLAEVGGTVGVVCPRSLVEQVRAELPADPRLQVLDTWQAKGLEFDGCAVVEPERIVAEGRTEPAGLRTLYVALTRATQRLTVVSDAPPDRLADPQAARASSR